MSGRHEHLSPVEAGRRLGVTVKALRLYEARGLVKPLRTANGWRAYGPEAMARLHQVLALKRLGLSLQRIADLLVGRGVGLDAVLGLQENALAGRPCAAGPGARAHPHRPPSGWRTARPCPSTTSQP